MRILGVDPGLRITGYGAIEGSEPPRLIEAGIITPPVRARFEARLGALHGELCRIIAAIKPDVMVVEELWTAYKNPATAVLMGHARGVLCLAAHDHGVPVRDLGHSMVKRALAGSGAASKGQVNRMVRQRLQIADDIDPPDVSDALALALALANVERTEQIFARRGLLIARA